MEPPVDAPVVRESCRIQHLLTPESPEGLRVVQITTNPDTCNSHIYMESHVFTPDSRRFVYQRFRKFDPDDPDKTAHDTILCLCDIEDGFSLRQLTDERGALAPSVSPDGKYVYYIVDQTVPGGGRAMLKRLSLDSYERETLLVIDSPLPGTNYRPSRFYVLSTISSDGRRLAISAFLGDGRTEGAPFGLLIFDLVDCSVSLVYEHPEFCNMHPQYCRSKDPEAGHDIMIQHNHGSLCDSQGKNIKLFADDLGGDIHVIRDDGTNWRDLPWGRDAEEFCHGHECWRGEGLSAIGGVWIGPMDPVHRPIIEARPVSTDESTSHRGKNLPGARRNLITREIDNPRFNHFAFDPSGTKMVSDWIRYAAQGRRGEDCRLFIGTLPEGEDSSLKVRYLLHPGCSWSNYLAHPHPFLSPDGRKAFFNSEVDGNMQICMVDGYEYP